MDKIAALIAEQLGIAESEVTDDKRFVEDLRADSLDVVQMLMTLENEFEIEFDDDEIAELHTVGDARAFILKKTGK